MPEDEQRNPMGGRSLSYLVPSFSVGLGAFVGVAGLTEIVQDIITQDPIEFTNKLAVGVGAALVTYGFGLLKMADSYYRE